MNNTLKIVVAAAPVIVVAYAALSKNATLDHLSEQYPEIDRKVAKRAYSRLMGQALRGKVDMSNYSTEQFNRLFLQEVAKITSK